MKIAIILPSFLLPLMVLSGCVFDSAPVVPNVPISVQPKQTVNIEPGLIKTCDPLQPLDATKAYSQIDTLDAINDWATQYDDCSKRFSKYVDLTSKALNINEVPGSPVPASATTIQQ